jgi:hypothetical protein
MPTQATRPRDPLYAKGGGIEEMLMKPRKANPTAIPAE